MSVDCKKAQAFDIMKALQSDGVFFSKKSNMGKKDEKKDMYELLIKMVAQQLLCDGIVDLNGQNDSKLEAYKQMKNMFPKEVIA